MKHFEEVEVLVKVHVVIQKRKHKALAKYIESRMNSALEGFNYENLGVTVSNLADLDSHEHNTYYYEN